MQHLVAGMIVCSEHWDRLRQLVCDRGMGHLLHQPHDEFEEFAAEICGHRARRAAFDPLVACRMVAQAIAVSSGGAYLTAGSAVADSLCPVCEIIRCLPAQYGIDPEIYWSAVVVGQVEEQARAKGLMPRAA